MKKITKDMLVKALTLGLITSGAVLVKEVFSDNEKDFVTIDLNKMINNLEE